MGAIVDVTDKLLDGDVNEIISSTNLFDKDGRGEIKSRGAKAITDAMTPDERAACEAAMAVQHPTALATFANNAAEKFVAQQHDLWATTAGDSNSKAISVQLAAAEMQGWDDQQIADRVFRSHSDYQSGQSDGEKIRAADVAVARKIADQVIANAKASEFPDGALSGLAMGGSNFLIREAVADAIPSPQVRSKVEFAVKSFARNKLLGDAHKAVLAANQRVGQKALAAVIGTSPTASVFLYRGLYPPTNTEIVPSFRSQSAPLSSWATTRHAARQFSGRGGYVLEAEVPVSSVVGLSSLGFGCFPEMEVIVNGDSFITTVTEDGGGRAVGSMFKAIPTINLDAIDINQDWPKRTPDTYAALGLPSPISKFNPYHDELGRFTTAGGDAYGGDTDRFTWAGSDLQDSPLQNKGAAVTQEFSGHYKVEYGDLDETVTDERGAGFAEEGSTHWGMWEGNYQMRNASAALMGLTPPKAKGGDDRHADPNMNEAYATGWVEGLTAIEQQNMARDIHTVNKVVQEISQASEDAPLLHRGMTDIDPDSHLLTAPIGSTYVTPLTAYSSDPATALGFAADDQYADRPEVMVVVKPGSKAVHGGEDSFYDVDTYRTATGWVRNDYGPTEHVSQGRYRIVDRIETVGNVRGATRTGRPKEAIITTVIVEQVSTHGGSGSGWRDNKNEADALPPGMREGLASDVRQLEMWKAQQEDVIPDWVWAMAGSLASGQVKKFNPHHDELGRFSSGPGGGGIRDADGYKVSAKEFLRLALGTDHAGGEVDGIPRSAFLAEYQGGNYDEWLIGQIERDWDVTGLTKEHIDQLLVDLREHGRKGLPETITVYRADDSDVVGRIDRAQLGPVSVADTREEASEYGEAVEFVIPREAVEFMNPQTYEYVVDPAFLRSGKVSKFNPHHDELGRFSSGPGGGVPAGPKRGQPHAASRKPSRLGMTGEPNPVTGKVMSNTEFGDTMETLFRQRAGRLSGFKQMFGTRLRALAGKGQQARTGPLDYRTSEYGLEVKSLNTRSKDKRVKIARRAAAAKQKKVERLGLKGGIVVQVVDFDRGVVTLYGWDKGFTNSSVKASPTSVNVQFNPMTQGAKVGEYRFTRSQWHKAQKETSRRDARGRVKGTWGDYDAPDTMGKSDDLAWRAELRKVREESGPLPRPDAVQRLMKDRGAPMTDEGEHIEPGDTVIELVEQEGDWVPHIYEAE